MSASRHSEHAFYTPAVPAKTLTQAWTSAEAKKPDGWQLKGVVLGPCEIDPTIRSPDWVAWARGPDGRREEGKARHPRIRYSTSATSWTNCARRRSERSTTHPRNTLPTL
jgi:hypothetical protein